MERRRTGPGERRPCGALCHTYPIPLAGSKRRNGWRGVLEQPLAPSRAPRRRRNHITDQYSDRAICLKRLLALIIFSCLRFSATHILATSSFFLCSSLSSICFSPQRDLEVRICVIWTGYGST